MSSTRRCPICVGEYDSSVKRPLVLTCGHTFCSECLSHMTDNTYRTCAVCRKSWSNQEVNDLPECYQLLPSDVTSEPLHCRPHNSQQLFWCLVCKEKLCRKCLRQQHRTCNWVLIEEQAEDLKAEVIEKISEAETKINDSLASIDTIVKENKTILDLYKNLHKALAKMNNEYTIYQQRIVLLQRKLNIQTTELEQLRTDWAIPPGSDLMCAVKEKMSAIQGVEAVIVWPERPHMRCLNSLIDNFQKCRDSNYDLTDVCEGLDLPLTDEEESEADDDENEEDFEDVEQEQEQDQEQDEDMAQEQEQGMEQEQEHDSGEEDEETNADNSVATAIEQVSSSQMQPDGEQFLPAPATSEFSNTSTQVSLESTTHNGNVDTESSTQNSWLTSSLLDESTHSVSTQFNLRPVISFFSGSSNQTRPFLISSQGPLRLVTVTSESQNSTTSQRDPTNNTPESQQLGNHEEPTGLSAAPRTESTRAQSALGFSTMFALARTSENVSVTTSTTSPFCFSRQPFLEVCRSSSLPKFPFSSQLSQNSTTSLLSMTTPSSKFERNLFQNCLPTQGPLFSFGSSTTSSAQVASGTQCSIFCQSGPISQLSRTNPSSGVSKTEPESSACSCMNGQPTCTTATNSAEIAGSMSQGNVPNSQESLEGGVSAPTTTVFATFKFQPAKAGTQTSPSHKILVLDGERTSTETLTNSENQIQPTEGVPSAVRLPIAENTSNLNIETEAQSKFEFLGTETNDFTASETRVERSHENGYNSSSSGTLLKSSASHSVCTQETRDGGEPSTLASESSRSAKKIHLQAAAFEENSESSGDSVSSSPRTDTLSRDVTDDDSVRGQLRLVQSSDLLRAFKKAMRELKKLKKSLKNSKVTKAKKETPRSAAELETEGTSSVPSGDAVEGACGGSVRPKQLCKDAASSAARNNTHESPAASPRSPAAERDEGESTCHTTLYSEHRKFLRRGGPFRRRPRKTKTSHNRAPASTSTAT